jgi:hypothetical protein
MRVMEHGCEVVLDTGPVRDLVHGSTIPDWVCIFSKMKAEGYRFSLADNACAELINQRSRGSIDDRDFETMIGCLESFLDPTVPVMLGEKDILARIVAGPRGAVNREAADMSHRAWSELRQRQICPNSQIEDVLEEGRAVWKELFQKVNAIYVERGRPADLDEYNHPILNHLLESMNERANVVPPLSIRLDLKVRYFWRQFVRSNKEHSAYNVNASKKRNDGIDFTVYTYLALPALVVATERGFQESIMDIPSFQVAWFHKPSSLVEAWIRGDRPQPRWP